MLFKACALMGGGFMSLAMSTLQFLSISKKDSQNRIIADQPWMGFSFLLLVKGRGKALLLDSRKGKSSLQFGLVVEIKALARMG